MPSTITAYYTFTAATKARSSQVNNNFSNHRGDLLPINEDTTTASNHTHDLGKSDHYWKTGYFNEVDLRTSTSTATLILKGDTSATAGAFDFQIEGSSVFKVRPSGFIADVHLTTTVRQLNCVTCTASGPWTVPAGVFTILLAGCGGGGGGGGGRSGVDASNYGGAGGGGGGGAPFVGPVACNVTPGAVLSITVGAAGSGGTANATGTAGGDSYITGMNDISKVIFPGAAGGHCAAALGQTALGGSTFPSGTFVNLTAYAGGEGGYYTITGHDGTAGTKYVTVFGASITGGLGMSGAASGLDGNGGGGGGGSIFGLGGNGGLGDTNLGTASNTAGSVPSSTAWGAGGGGGGGGGEASNVVGQAGGNGIQGIVFLYYIK
jgi:hypothetical protein